MLECVEIRGRFVQAVQLDSISQRKAFQQTSGTAVADANDPGTLGVVRVNGSTTANVPFSDNANYPMLTICTLDGIRHQIIYTLNAIYSRRGSASGWQTWYKLEGTPVS